MRRNNGRGARRQPYWNQEAGSRYMKWSYQIGKPFGIPLRVHVTFLILLLLAAWGGANLTHSWRGTAMWVAFMSAIFSCVVLHELVHSLQARRYGIRVTSILLLPIGGVAQMERIPEDPNQELTISIMGPVTNVVIALLIALPVWVFAGPERLHVTRANMDPATNFWGALVLTNVGLAVFNLLPAFPMDGGRMLRAVLAQHLDYVRATDIAARVGQICAFAMGLSVLWHNNWILVFIAFMVYIGATHEARMVRARAVLRRIPVSYTMATAFSVVSPSDFIGTVLAYSAQAYQHDFPVVQDGRLVGVVGHEQMVKALRERGPYVTVHEVMQRGVPMVTLTDNLYDLQEKMQTARVSIVPVVDAGHVVGVVTLDRINQYLGAAIAHRRA